MIKSSITYTKGKDWWLSRRDEDGREHYPDQIRVGSLEDPRVFVPERTCRDTDHMQDAIKCSECGEITPCTLYWVYFDDGLRTVKGHRPRFCSNCGARVVSE